MRDYAVLLRYDLLKIKNYILEIRRSPKKLVSYVLFCAWMLMVMLPAIMQRGHNVFQVSPDTAQMIIGIYTILVSVLFYMSLFASLRKLSYSFQMGDVNLMFPSPLEPNRILFWSLLKKIPTTLGTTFFPVLVLTPTLVNLGLGTGRIVLVYLSIGSLALLITPISFLIFLLSSRFEVEKWCRSILLLSLAWMVVSWLKYVNGDIFSLGVFAGYKAPGVLWLPVLGWIVQLADNAFFGVAYTTYISLALVVLTAITTNILLFILARDYYEDVLEYTEKIETLRAAKRSGKMQGLLAQNRTGETKLSLWAERFKKKEVLVKGGYPREWAFMYKQTVNYRRTGFNEYVGYVSLLCVFGGLVTAILAFSKGPQAVAGISYAMNGAIAYMLIFRSFTGPLSTELALPYFYTLPGTFRKKVLAVDTLPTLRFAINLLLLNISFAIGAQQKDLIVPGIVLALLVISVYYEQSNCIALGHVLLPSSIDRKLFFPLLLFVQMIIIAIPAAIVAVITGLITQNALLTQIAVVVTNFAVGTLLLLLSDSIFAHLEMREFAD